MATNWIIVERPENWRVDREEGFVRFGLPERRRKMSDKVRAGDLLFVYISGGKSAFADVRKATRDGTSRLRFGGEYDSPFPMCIVTEPYLTLEPHQWVPVHDLVHRLELTKDRKDWRQVFRQTLRQISNHDADVIMTYMQSQQRQNMSSGTS